MIKHLSNTWCEEDLGPKINEIIDTINALTTGSIQVPSPPIVASGNYGPTDKVPRPVPESELLVMNSRTDAPYLQGRVWWALEEMARTVGQPVQVLRACKLTDDGSMDTHTACNHLLGGMMVDIKHFYGPDGLIDLAATRKAILCFRDICFPIPADYKRDSSSPADFRVGYKDWLQLGFRDGSHVSGDDAMGHSSTDPVNPHIHLFWVWWNKETKDIDY